MLVIYGDSDITNFVSNYSMYLKWTKLDRTYYRYCSIRFFLTTCITLSLCFCVCVCVCAHASVCISDRSRHCWIQTGLYSALASTTAPSVSLYVYVCVVLACENTAAEIVGKHPSSSWHFSAWRNNIYACTKSVFFNAVQHFRNARGRQTSSPAGQSSAAVNTVCSWEWDTLSTGTAHPVSRPEYYRLVSTFQNVLSKEALLDTNIWFAICQE